MTDVCLDPLHYLEDRLRCRVYLDRGGNVRLGFSKRHGLEDMMTAHGIARSNAGVLRAQLRQDRETAVADVAADEAPAIIESVLPGAFCPIRP